MQASQWWRPPVAPISSGCAESRRAGTCIIAAAGDALAAFLALPIRDAYIKCFGDWR
jgi:hypothetical protein